MAVHHSCCVPSVDAAALNVFLILRYAHSPCLLLQSQLLCNAWPRRNICAHICYQKEAADYTYVEYVSAMLLSTSCQSIATKQLSASLQADRASNLQASTACKAW